MPWSSFLFVLTRDFFFLFLQLALEMGESAQDELSMQQKFPLVNAFPLITFCFGKLRKQRENGARQLAFQSHQEGQGRPGFRSSDGVFWLKAVEGQPLAYVLTPNISCPAVFTEVFGHCFMPAPLLLSFSFCLALEGKTEEAEIVREILNEILKRLFFFLN